MLGLRLRLKPTSITRNVVPKKKVPIVRRESTMWRTSLRAGPLSRASRKRSSPAAMPSRASTRSCRCLSRSRLAASRRLVAGGSGTRRPATTRFGVFCPRSRLLGVTPLRALSDSGSDTATEAAGSSGLRRNSDGTTRRVADAAEDQQRRLPLSRNPSDAARSAQLDVRTQGVELALEVLVAALDELHAVDPRGALGRQRRDQVAEPGPQVGDHQVGRVQLGRPGDDRRVHEVAPAEAAGGPAEAFTVRLDGGAHLVER